MVDAFISYSRKNKDFVQSLNQMLINRRNKDTWIDWDDIKPGIHFWDEIKAGIAHADSFISIISPDSMVSVICHLEINYAIELRKRIVPVIYQDIDPETIFSAIASTKIDEAMEDRLAGKNPQLLAMENWRQLSHINWTFFRESDNFDQSFLQLIQAVETDIDYVKAHTRYLIRAQEWLDRKEQADLLLFGKDIKLAEAWLQTAEKYKDQAEQEKVDVLNPMPVESHQKFIKASRKAQKFRWGVGVATVLSMLALIVLVILASNIISNTNTFAKIVSS